MVPGMGWTMRECSDEVLLGMMRLSSSRLTGRESPERGLEVNEGAIADGSSQNATGRGGSLLGRETGCRSTDKQQRLDL